MGKHDGCKRAFIQLSRTWYADSVLKYSPIVDEITIGMYHPDGGTSGEFCIRWEPLWANISPRLLCFDDSWSALCEFKDMLDFMAEFDDTCISPDEFRDKLISLGIQDITQCEPVTELE